MLRFAGFIIRDPTGYEWNNDEGSSREADGEERYNSSVFLQPRSFEKYERLISTGEGIPQEHCYDPFVEEPALFRIFGKVEPTEQAILEFANRYGDLLGHDEMVEGEFRTLEDWVYQIREMKASVEFVDSFQKRSNSGRQRPRSKSETLEFINTRLAYSRVYLQADEKRGRTALEVIVVSLLDVMKLQLVTSVIEGKKYRECEHCSKPFEVTPQINRADRVFCSDNCRVKAYYRRKKEAVRMRQSGLHLREIVKKTGSDLKTVKGWVQHIPRKEKQ